MKFTSITLALLSLAATNIAAPIDDKSVAAPSEVVGTTDVDEASLVTRGNCNLHAHWESNWSESGWRRYRVKAWADVGGPRTNTREMLVQWTAIASGFNSGVFAGTQNLGSWLENDNLAFIDLSFWEGSEGHKLYLEFHQVTVNRWREWSGGCDVDSRF